ncbi:hypothetical protein FRC08_004641 [Ceratobasidium sp. 394]|nr:hypothetical protein FRC08_004641 [Ceratobasidium sp. 394]
MSARKPHRKKHRTSALDLIHANMLRRLLRAVSATPSQQPIEFIVSTFVVITLAYFQVLHAFKTSEVVVPYSARSARLLPAYARVAADSGASWIPADETQWIAAENKLDLVQLTFEPRSHHAKLPSKSGQTS